MRMIDADMLADGLKLHRQSTDQKHETDRQWAVGYNAGLERALYSISYAPTLTPPNEPLTLDELREMDGEPVWDEKGKCYLVDTTYQFCSDSDIEIAIVDKRSIKRYPYRRTLYRRPPEGEA